MMILSLSASDKIFADVFLCMMLIVMGIIGHSLLRLAITKKSRPAIRHREERAPPININEIQRARRLINQLENIEKELDKARPKTYRRNKNGDIIKE